MLFWNIPGSHQINHGQLYGHEHGSKCADAMRYRKHAENSEDTCEAADGTDSWNPPKLADSFPSTFEHPADFAAAYALASTCDLGFAVAVQHQPNGRSN